MVQSYSALVKGSPNLCSHAAVILTTHAPKQYRLMAFSKHDVFCAPNLL